MEMDTARDQGFSGIAARAHRCAIWAIATVLLLGPLVAEATSPGRVSQSDFARLAISFDPYSWHKTGGLIAKDEDWSAYSKQIADGSDALRCKPVATSIGTQLMQVAVHVRMPRLNEAIVPVSGEAANPEVVAHLEKLLAPTLARDCQAAGDKIDLWVGFMFSDVVSARAVVSYTFSWSGGHLQPSDRAGGSWSTDRNPADATKKGYLKYASGETYYYRLLGEELPDAPLPAVRVATALSPAPAAPVAATPEKGKAGALRSENYWLRFNNSEMGDVFAGRLRDANNNVVFMEAFRRFQSGLFYACPAMVPADSPAIYYEKTIKFGGTGTEIKQESDRIRIRSTRWAPFKAAADGLTRAYSRIDFSNPMASARFAFNTITSVIADMDRLFQENACGSATLIQFDENLLRLATGKEPLRTKPGDGSASDVAEKPAFAVACYLHEKKLSDNARRRNPSEFFDADRKRTWCNCLEREFKGVVPLAEMDAAISDFRIVSRWIDPPVGEPNNPRWPRVNASYRCKNTYR